MPNSPGKGGRGRGKKRPEASAQLKNHVVFIAGERIAVLGDRGHIDSASPYIGGSGFKFSDVPDGFKDVRGFFFVDDAGRRRPIRVCRVTTGSETVLRRMLEDPIDTERRATAGAEYCKKRRLVSFGKLEAFVGKHGPLRDNSGSVVYKSHDGSLIRSGTGPNEDYRARDVSTEITTELSRLYASAGLWLQLMHSLNDMALFAAEFALQAALRQMQREESQRLLDRREGPFAMKVNGRIYVYQGSSNCWAKCENVVDLNSGELSLSDLVRGP